MKKLVNILIGASVTLTSLSCLGARLGPHDRNTRAIDRDSARVEILKKDFSKNQFHKYCKDLKEPAPLSCFAHYLESKKSNESISVIEAANLAEVAKNLTIVKAAGAADPKVAPIDRFESAVNFLALLSGIYVISENYKSLVPGVSKPNDSEEKYEVEQLQSIERDTAVKLRTNLKAKLIQLSIESKNELLKLEDSPKRKELEQRLEDIKKTASL